MEKKSKKTIIIGITCLLLVTLILLGLTYAYYRTRIIGNDAETSISVTSKKMEVTYEDGTATLSTEGKIEPGFIASKTFYVTNTGDQSVNYSILLEDMTNEFERNQDWTYTLTENGTQIASGYLAVGTHQVLSGSRTIAATNGTTNTYVLTITYTNLTDIDQSSDMGSVLSFKVNIGDETGTWEVPLTGSLLAAIKTNSPSLASAEDDYGTSYYYPSSSTDNYVTYSGMCWRVLRVQGDGTVKLVLADSEHVCRTPDTSTPDGYVMNVVSDANGTERYDIAYTSVDGLSGSIFENGLIPNILSDWAESRNLDTSKLVTTDWCNDTSIHSIYDYTIEGGSSIFYYFGAYNRLVILNAPSLKCNFKGLEVNGETTKAIRYNNILGIISADEARIVGNGGYLNATSGYSSWYMTPYNDEYSPSGGYDFLNLFVENNFDGSSANFSSVIPSIVLRSDVLLSTAATTQDGKIDTAYIID